MIIISQPGLPDFVGAGRRDPSLRSGTSLPAPVPSAAADALYNPRLQLLSSWRLRLRIVPEISACRARRDTETSRYDFLNFANPLSVNAPCHDRPRL